MAEHIEETPAPEEPDERTDEFGGESDAAVESTDGDADGDGEAGLDVDQIGPRPVTELKKPSTLGGVIYLAVLAGALIGVCVAGTGAWRTGVSWLSLSLLAAAAARLALKDDDAGMLRVRRKGLDATILVVMGVALLALVATIPDQPG
ncbi:DUF3017 domain-containing protein [Nocardioides jensenii]|uniref:DUF3017 domain-containing protein n=1 Tax=Nocardioides jensenii TaxID=1843 RepID=UPI00083268D0|nr:DUF3017 domain-containing protein [Nocardioides jensenii]